MQKSELITMRTTPEIAKKLKKLMQIESRTLADEARLVLEVGSSERLKELVIEKYMKGAITLEKAAEIAEVSVWDMMEIFAKERVPYNLDVTALKNELKK